MAKSSTKSFHWFAPTLLVEFAMDKLNKRVVCHHPLAEYCIALVNGCFNASLCNSGNFLSQDYTSFTSDLLEPACRDGMYLVYRVNTK
ncbi:MAG: hypothetical protein IPL74_19025 [Bacteroidetes bacterium]|nr:hypothetical protein [Bacteroidota bacterium]